MTVEQLRRDNAKLRKKIRGMIYGDVRDPRMSQEKAEDGGALLSDAEMEVLYRMEREGTL